MNGTIRFQPNIMLLQTSTPGPQFFGPTGPSTGPTAVDVGGQSVSTQPVTTDPTQTVMTQPVMVGPMLGLGGGAPAQTTIGDALSEFYSLPRDELIQLEEQLWAGGFYRDASGAVLTKAPTFGVYDAASLSALKYALEQASQQGTDLQSVINQNIGAGVGNQDRTVYAPGVLQHGYHTTIDLANPADVAYLVDQMSEKLQGKFAADDVKNAITSMIQEQGRIQGQQRFAASEQMYQNYYQERVQARNEQTNAQVQQMTPRIAGGAAQPIAPPGAAGPAAGIPAGGAAPLSGAYGLSAIPTAAQNTPAPLAPAGVGGAAGGVSPQAAANTGPGGVDAFLAATRDHESGGNYSANSGNGAYGAYQFVPDTWNAEATAAGFGQYANGRADLAPQDVQDAVARFYANFLFNGDAGLDWGKVAGAWYVGHVPTPDELNTVPGTGNNETVQGYEDAITQAMGPGGTENVPQLGPNVVQGPDQYIPGAYTETVNPASAEAAAYNYYMNDPTQRPITLAHASAQAYQTMLDLINARE